MYLLLGGQGQTDSSKLFIITNAEINYNTCLKYRCQIIIAPSNFYKKNKKNQQKYLSKIFNMGLRLSQVNYYIMSINSKEKIIQYLEQISNFISDQIFKRIVLQMTKQLLPLSFDLVSQLGKTYQQSQFFVLYDSLKQPCCVDTLGAQHIGYDCLIHFGPACFSSPCLNSQCFIFNEMRAERTQQISQLLNSAKFEGQIASNNVGYIMVDQPYYHFVKKIITNRALKIQILALPFDKKQGDQYLIFGYHCSSNKQIPKNILIVADQQGSQNQQQMTLSERLNFSLKTLGNKVGNQVFILGQQQNNIVIPTKANNSKRLMQRYSIISQLQKQQIFGIIVSNTNTTFFNRSLKRCQQILKKHGKKVFSFMMNNLNEVKLGNFPEIQVYVIVSCFNHSLFSLKDFHRLVVTPNDLEVAFEKRSFDEYAFDLNSQLHETILEVIEQKQMQPQHPAQQSTEVSKMANREIMLQNKIQALAYYKEREYKGLQFNEEKEVKKMTKGKIGLAQQYKKLQ